MIDIAGRKIGAGHSCYVIAETGVNHNGDLDLAHRLIDAALDAGADAVKFQTFNSARLVSSEAPKAQYQLATTAADETQLEMIRRLELSPSAHYELQSHCRERGIEFLSTPFDLQSVDLLNQIGVPAFKIGSGDVSNSPLLGYISRLGKPIILSTGMSYLSEVETAVEVIRSAGNNQLVLLQCVSNYPAAPTDANLRAMITMAETFHLPVGYSDHTEGTTVATAAVALGACVIEKHLTLNRELPGPDHKSSLEPAEFSELVRAIRTTEAALGTGEKVPAESETNTRMVARRSLAAAVTLKPGTVLRPDMLSELRPGTGISPSSIADVVGRTMTRTVESGQLLSWSDFQ